MNLLIDSDLRVHIPPLTNEEYNDLESSLLEEGCRDSLIIWKEKGILVDGHNRYDICTRNNIPFRVSEKSFKDKDAVMDWMDKNQLARRNLTSEQASLLRGRRYNRIKRQDAGHGNQKSGGQNVTPNQAKELGKQYGVDERTIKRDGQFAAAVEELEAVIPDITQKVLSGDIVKKDVIEAAKTPEKAAEILETKSKPHVSFNSGENEWYTPECYIIAAREAMGSIDTDPASSEIANTTVKASQYFTIQTDGRQQTWTGNVWMNPPYAQPLVTEFCSLLVGKFNNKEIKQACVLVNNATETNFYQTMLGSANAVCFIKSRVKFLNADGKSTGAPLQGQTILYFGNNVKSFTASFSQYGVILYA